MRYMYLIGERLRREKSSQGFTKWRIPVFGKCLRQAGVSASREGEVVSFGVGVCLFFQSGMNHGYGVFIVG